MFPSLDLIPATKPSPNFGISPNGHWIQTRKSFDREKPPTTLVGTLVCRLSSDRSGSADVQKEIRLNVIDVDDNKPFVAEEFLVIKREENKLEKVRMNEWRKSWKSTSFSQVYLFVVLFVS